MLPLFEKFSGLKDLSRVPLGNFPTPVHALKNIGKDLGVSELYIKRDDLSSSWYGGNKIRKLEFLLGQWQAEGKKTIVTGGGLGSHMVLAMAIAAQKFGLHLTSCHFDQPLTDHVKETLLLDHHFGAEMIYSGRYPWFIFDLIRCYLRKRYHHPSVAFLFPGGSTPRSTIGYVNAAFELKSQIDAGDLPEPDVIFITAGSCGTMAGLVLGARLAGIRSQILGVRVVDRIVANSAQVARLANQTLFLLSQYDPSITKPRLSQNDIFMLHDFFGDAYGFPTPEANQAIQWLKDREGIGLESTYTGKTFAALIHFIQQNRHKSQKVLFWHTFNNLDLSAHLSRVSAQNLPEAFLRFVH